MQKNRKVPWIDLVQEVRAKKILLHNFVAEKKIHAWIIYVYFIIVVVVRLLDFDRLAQLAELESAPNSTECRRMRGT